MRRRRFSASYREAVLATSPVAYWRLGEASGTVARDEMGLHHGTYVGGPTLGVPRLLAGDPDTAVTFPGAAAASGRLTFVLPAMATWTIAFLINRGNPAGRVADRIFACPALEFELSMFNSGTLHFYDGAWADMALGLAVGTPTDVVVSYASGHLCSYKDGGVVQDTNRGRALGAGTYSFGAAPDGTVGENFTGDELAIFNRALSAAEIAELFRVGTGQ